MHDVGVPKLAHDLQLSVLRHITRRGSRYLQHLPLACWQVQVPLTLNRLSCRTRFTATRCPVSLMVASNTSPKEPFPNMLDAEYARVAPCVEGKQCCDFRRNGSEAVATNLRQLHSDLVSCHGGHRACGVQGLHPKPKSGQCSLSGRAARECGVLCENAGNVILGPTRAQGGCTAAALRQG